MTEYELITQYKTAKINWPTVYRTLMLVSEFSSLIKTDIDLSKYGRSSGGKLIRNTRAYRRAGGSLDRTPPQVTQEYKKAWIFFRSRADDIAKFLYAKQEKGLASPIYAFAKQYSSQGLQKAASKFLGRGLDALVSQILTTALQTEFKDSTIKAVYHKSTKSLEIRQGNRMLLETEIRDKSPYLEYRPVSDAVRKVL